MSTLLKPTEDEGPDARQRSEPSGKTTQHIHAAPAAPIYQACPQGMTPGQHAVYLALNGCPVFPCWPDGYGTRDDGRPRHKSPRVTDWRNVATKDVDQVLAWWRQWPDALVAVPTGAPSGLYVLDLDVKPTCSGIESLTTLGLIPPPTRINHTLTGGSHYLYQMPPEGFAKTDASVIAPGVDRRGDGGYIIWWPAHGGAVEQGPLAVPPDWMIRDAIGHRPEVSFPPIGLTDAEMANLMDRVQPVLMDSRSEWIKVGMALHHETEGAERGLVIWDRYSQTWPKYEGRASLEREWASFGRGRGSHISMRSLMPRSWQRLPTEVGFGGAEIPVGAMPVPPPPPLLGTTLPAQGSAPQVPGAIPRIPMFVPPLPQGMIDARDGTATSRPLTEHGNTLRLYDRHGQDLRYVPETKGWLYWSDGAWHWDNEGAVPRNMAGNLFLSIYREGFGNIHEADAYAKWAKKSQEARIVRASVSMLSDMGVLRVSVGLIDQDIMLTGLDGGRLVLDLRNGNVRAAQQTDLITKSLGVRELGSARECVRWLNFLEQVFNGDKELINWIQRWCGYVLTGDVSEQFFCFAFGSGRNGKGTFSELLKFIMGDYARTVAPETLTEAKRAAGGASPDIVALAGARLALSAETNDGSHMAEGLIKTLTGGDTITARPLYGGLFEFIPQMKMLISGNHKPVIKGVDYAVWARVRLIPFTRTFTDAQRDPKLQSKLRAEAPHILAWMLEGCLEWQKRGLQDVPKSIAEATQDYRSEMDIMGEWIAECLVVDDATATVPAGMLYTSYKNWAIDNGYKVPMTNQALCRAMEDRGFVKKHTNTANVWIGVRLRI